MTDDHNGEILKHVTGHRGSTEGKNKKRGSKQECITRKCHQSDISENIPPALVSLWYALKQSSQEAVRTLTCLAFHYIPC